MSQASTPQSPPPSLEDNDALLTYRIGPVYCCGPSLPIITITPPPPLTHPPGANIAEPGIFKHGNHIVTTTDLRYRFGVKQENWKQPGQVIIAQHDDTTRGYFVDEIIDVIRFPKSGWGNLPSHLPRGVFSRTLLFNEKIYLYADFEKLSALQGSGYLADYIEQLDKEKTSVSITKATKTSFEKITKTVDDNQTPSVRIALTKTKKTSLSENQDPKITTEEIREKKYNNTSAIKEQAKILPIDAEEVRAERLKTTPSHIQTDRVESMPLNTIVEHKTHKNKSNDLTHSQEPTTSTIDKDASLKSSIIKPKIEKPRKETTQIQTTMPKISSRITNSIDRNIPAENKNTYHASNKESAVIEPDTNNLGAIIFVFIILMFSAAAYYYYSTSMQAEKPIKINYLPQDTKKQDYATVIPLTESIKEHSTNFPEQPQAITKQNETVDSEIIQNNALNIKNNSENKSLTEAITKTFKKPEYSATIAEVNDTITIELSGPQPPKVNNIEEKKAGATTFELTKPKQDVYKPEASKTEALAETIKLEVKESDTKKPEMQIIYKNASNLPARSMQIIHIIVKGDTLWAIAKYYLQNPFLYPELAKLSKIKNPDLIYPGNRVRIIYRGNKAKQ